eukprot:gene13138-biopygen521
MTTPSPLCVCGSGIGGTLLASPEFEHEFPSNERFPFADGFVPFVSPLPKCKKDVTLETMHMTVLTCCTGNSKHVAACRGRILGNLIGDAIGDAAGVEACVTVAATAAAAVAAAAIIPVATLHTRGRVRTGLCAPTTSSGCLRRVPSARTVDCVCIELCAVCLNGVMRCLLHAWSTALRAAQLGARFRRPVGKDLGVPAAFWIGWIFRSSVFPQPVGGTYSYIGTGCGDAAAAEADTLSIPLRPETDALVFAGVIPASWLALAVPGITSVPYRRLSRLSHLTRVARAAPLPCLPPTTPTSVADSHPFQSAPAALAASPVSAGIPQGQPPLLVVPGWHRGHALERSSTYLSKGGTRRRRASQQRGPTAPRSSPDIPKAGSI